MNSSTRKSRETYTSSLLAMAMALAAMSSAMILISHWNSNSNFISVARNYFHPETTTTMNTCSISSMRRRFEFFHRRDDDGDDDDDGHRRRLLRKNIFLQQHTTLGDSFAPRELSKDQTSTTAAATINMGILVDAAATAAGRELSFLEENIQLARTTYKLPTSIEQNFMDWNSKIDNDTDAVHGLPIFWHILKSGGTTIKLMYAQCYHLVEACETGALIDDGSDASQQRRRRQQQQQQQQPQQQQQRRENIQDSSIDERRRLIPMKLLTFEGEGGNAPALLLSPLPQEEYHQQQHQQQLRTVISEDGRKYVNVDVTTSEGIQHASQLGFASSQLADVIFTPLLLESAELLFTNNNNNKKNDDSTARRSNSYSRRKGRMFALFRHPIQRVTSIFYYLQSATWEPTYNPEYAQWTIHDYAKSPHCESNWMVRSLVQKMTGPLIPRDVLVAQEILRRKWLVGLMEEMEESIRRFHSLFFHPHFVGKDAKEEENASFHCAMEHFARKGLSGQNSHRHPTLDETSETWEILATKNQLDIQLYEYAKELFFEQGKWLKKEKALI